MNEEILDISIYPKDTAANTQYYEVHAEYEDYIYYWLERFLADVSELITHNEDLCKDMLKRRPKLFPKGKHGPNSVLSFTGGMVANRKVNDKKNISEPQLEGLEFVFRMMAHHYNQGAPHPGPYKQCLPIRFRKSFFGL